MFHKNNFTVSFFYFRRANDIRRHRAAITCQKYIRGWIKKVQYQRLRQCILGLQTRARGYLARQKYLQLKYNANVCNFAKSPHYAMHFALYKLLHQIRCQLIAVPLYE